MGFERPLKTDVEYCYVVDRGRPGGGSKRAVPAKHPIGGPLTVLQRRNNAEAQTWQ